MHISYFYISRLAHIATAREIASKTSNNNIIIFIGNFNGFDKAFNAAERDLCWNEVKRKSDIISALKGYKSYENELYVYTDFGFAINYYLRKISKRNRINVYQDGSANISPLGRSLKFLDGIYSVIMGYNFSCHNFAGQSRYTSSIYLHHFEKFTKQTSSKVQNKLNLKKIETDFISCIRNLEKFGYLNSFVCDKFQFSNELIVYFPGWSINSKFLEYLLEKFGKGIYIKIHPACNDLSKINLDFIKLDPTIVAEQIIPCFINRSKKLKVILENESISYSFLNHECVEFYLLDNESKEVSIKHINK